MEASWKAADIAQPDDRICHATHLVHKIGLCTEECVDGEGSGENGCTRIRERGILDEVSPSAESIHCTVKVRLLCGPRCERILAGAINYWQGAIGWEWRDCRASERRW